MKPSPLQMFLSLVSLAVLSFVNLLDRLEDWIKRYKPQEASLGYYFGG